jgi:Restriction Enzyme Adenine Methylase Associated
MATLADPVASGALPVGTFLSHAGGRHQAEGRVGPGGIEVGGKVHRSPSTAARAVAGTSGENGWTWWRLKESGRPLGELREQ